MGLQKGHKYALRDGNLVDITGEKPTVTELNPEELPFRVVNNRNKELLLYIKRISQPAFVSSSLTNPYVNALQKISDFARLILEENKDNHG